MNTYSLYNMYGVLKTREDDVKEELKEKSYSGPLALVKKKEYFRSKQAHKVVISEVPDDDNVKYEEYDEDRALIMNNKQISFITLTLEL